MERAKRSKQEMLVNVVIAVVVLLALAVLAATIWRAIHWRREIRSFREATQELRREVEGKGSGDADDKPR